MSNWKSEPDDHDYPAAISYLSLVVAPDVAESTAEALRSAPLVTFKAKDLLRASALALLGPDNVHVAKDLAKIRQGKKLSPVLLVRGDLANQQALTVADGYHRICASYHEAEDDDVACRIVNLTS